MLFFFSWASGANAWGPEKDEKFTKPNHWDGVLEVVGVTGVAQMGQIQGGLRSGIRIVQVRTIYCMRGVVFCSHCYLRQAHLLENIFGEMMFYLMFEHVVLGNNYFDFIMALYGPKFIKK